MDSQKLVNRNDRMPMSRNIEFVKIESRTTVQPIARNELTQVVAIHQNVLDDEFITRFGRGFLRRYYMAFIDSPYAVALAALDEGEEQEHVAGVLLGTLHPAQHYHYLVRRHGSFLAGHVAMQALLHPVFGYELYRTRAKRYVQGIYRSLQHRGSSPSNQEIQAPQLVGDLTHLAVNPAHRGKGIGSLLVRAYEQAAREARLDRIDLVTLPRELGGAGVFYERLGWLPNGTQISRSGEKFIRYSKHLGKRE